MADDNFTREIIHDALVAVGDEMFQTVINTSMSPVIYEVSDFGVGATDSQGNLVAQGNGMIVFVGSLEGAVKGTLGYYSAELIRDGDIFITNSPYEGGGTHLSDVSILCPVFLDNQLIAWTAVKAHWTEIGGMQAGSLTTASTDVFQEGLTFHFLKLFDRGEINESLVSMIRNNVRLPDSTLGDMHASVAACRVGARRIIDLAGKYGISSLREAMASLLDYGERMTIEELKMLPRGRYTASNLIEEDGQGGGPFYVKVNIDVSASKMVMDFSGSSPQAAGPINLTYPALLTAARCMFKAVTNADIPVNGGCFRPLEVRCEPGTIVSATRPAPVSIYYDAFQAAMDVIAMALAPLVPDRLPAGHQRSPNGMTVTGLKPGTDEMFVYGQMLAGGWGASIDADGQNGLFSSGTGEVFNIPVELAESRCGLQITKYGFHDEDGGGGQYRGGKGIELSFEITSDEAFLTYMASQTRTRPWALHGGMEGSFNRAELLRIDGTKDTFTLVTGACAKRGDVFRMITGTGGGYGDPKLRPIEAVRRDLRDGYITKAQATRDCPQLTAVAVDTN